MANIYYSIPGSLSGGAGGPSIHVGRMTQALKKLGHNVMFDKPQRSDVAMAIISVGKLIRQINMDKTRLVLRCDGIYQKEYDKLFKRKVRGDMVALHNDLRVMIPRVSHVVFQSQFSREAIINEDTIFNGVEPSNIKYSIIPNGCDVNTFKPLPKQDDGFVKLIAIGKMRDFYYMKTLIQTYHEVKRRGHKTKLILVGTMDAACISEYKKYKSDQNIIHIGSFPNNKLNQAYNKGSIYIDARQGSSSNNTVAEAQAAGLPVVCPSWSGSGEMIIHNKTGQIVDGGRWNYNNQYINNLADGVEKIISDLQGYSDRARKHARQNLSLELMVKRYLKAMKL